jgi:hypothetical protein
VAGPFRVRVEHLALLANSTAGCDPFTVMAHAHRMRWSPSWDPAPVLVNRETVPGVNPPLWRVLDGRHRFLAAVIAGRPDVLCVEEAP